MAKLYAEIRAAGKQRAYSVASNEEIIIMTKHKNICQYDVHFDEFGIRVWEYGAGRYMLETGAEERAKWNEEENKRLSEKYGTQHSA